jgi:hypothetical protein
MFTSNVGRRRLKQTVAAVSVLAGLVAMSGAAFAKGQEYPPVGASGDRSSDARCPAGQYLVGLRTQSGAWMDNLALNCAPVNTNGSTGNITRDRNVYGGTGGGPSEKNCPTGRFVSSLGFVMTGGNRQVVYFALVCHSTTTKDSAAIEIGARSTLFPNINQSCPAGQAAVGIAVRYGKHVNAAGLLCDGLQLAGNSGPTGPIKADTSLTSKLLQQAAGLEGKCVRKNLTTQDTACPNPTGPVTQTPDGECTHFVQLALRLANAKAPVFDQNLQDKNYDWGAKTTYANLVREVQPGDILQSWNARFSGPNGASWGTAVSTDPKNPGHHTALVVAKNGDMITVLEQNSNNLRLVKRNTYNMAWAHSGDVFIYRAEK